MPILATKVVEVALGYLGVPWLHRGRTKELGVDCTGLIFCSFNESGAEVVDNLDYKLVDEFKKLIKVLNQNCDRVEDLLLADILMFRGPDMFNHIGLYLGDNRFIHSYSNRVYMQVCIHSLDGYWRMRLRGIYRFRGIIH